jgi:hypothetical protein
MVVLAPEAAQLIPAELRTTEALVAVAVVQGHPQWQEGVASVVAVVAH